MDGTVGEFDERFIKSQCESNNKGYILEVDVKYPKNLLNLHIDITCLPERKKIGKSKKLFCNIT